MNAPLRIAKFESKFSVDWSKNGKIDDFIKSIDFCELAFIKTKCERLGVIVELNEGWDIMYLSSELLYSRSFKEYSQYVRSMYVVKGLVFEKETEAKTFYDEVHKTLTWSILSGN